MKKTTKLKLFAIAIVVLPVFLIIIVVVMLFMLGSDDGKNALAGSVFDDVSAEIDPERIEELMRLKAFGVPIDIVMMVTTYVCEPEEEANKKPFIFPSLEFMVMTEEVKDYKHHHGDKDPDDDYHSNCGYETTKINTYEYKDKIKSYLGITDEESSGLNASNLFQLAQAAADERCSSEQIRLISFEAVWFAEYEEAIKRCGVKDENDIQGILELHKAGYFNELLNDIAQSIGADPGESTVTGGSTHSSIRNAIQRPDLIDMAFFGGPARLPLDSGIFSLTSEFGWRDYPPDPYHTGLDFAPPKGMHPPIYSVMDGIVLMRMTNMNSFGHYIVIYHGGGITTMYAHMYSFGSFKVGDRVNAGDIIGYVGTTGKYSTGDHLHFEYQVSGTPHNPRELLPLS